MRHILHVSHIWYMWYTSYIEYMHISYIFLVCMKVCVRVFLFLSFLSRLFSVIHVADAPVLGCITVGFHYTTTMWLHTMKVPSTITIILQIILVVNSNIVIIMLTSRFFSMGWQYNNSSDGPNTWTPVRHEVWPIRAPDNNSSPRLPHFLPILFRFTFQERSQIFFWLGHPEPNAHQIQQIRNETDSIHGLWLNTYSNPHPPKQKKMNGKHIWGWGYKSGPNMIY